MVYQTIKYRLTLILLFVCITFTMHAQSQEVNKYCDIVTETLCSFFDNPAHHSNTIKIYNLLEKQLKVGEQLEHLAWEFNNMQDFYCIQNSINLIKVTKQLVGEIIGQEMFYSTTEEMTTLLNPILIAFDWEITHLCSCTDIELYEYKKDSFKMVLSKNTRPKPDSPIGPFHYVDYCCYDIDVFHKLSPFRCKTIGGSHYQLVQYQDDTNKNKTYHNIKKVTSKRRTK